MSMLRAEQISMEDGHGAEKAMITCWWQWRWHNEEIFNGVRLELQEKIWLLSNRLEEEEMAFTAISSSYALGNQSVGSV